MELVILASWYIDLIDRVVQLISVQEAEYALETDRFDLLGINLLFRTASDCFLGDQARFWPLLVASEPVPDDLPDLFYPETHEEHIIVRFFLSRVVVAREPSVFERNRVPRKVGTIHPSFRSIESCH
jgi:hypothetical protein